MKTFVISALTLCISTVCFAQDNYHNDDLGFSIEIPPSMEIFHKDELSDKDQKILEILYGDETAIICQEIGAKFFSYPCIEIQTKRFERTTDFKIERILKSPEGEKKTLRSVDYLADWLIMKIKDKVKQVESDYYYDTTKHIATGRMIFRHENGEKIVVIIARILGNSRMTTLRCHWRGTNPNEFISLVDKVIDSFEYDEGYGFGGGGGLSSSILGSSSGKSVMEQKVVSFFVDALIFAVCLWLGMKITGEEGSFGALVFISAVSSLVGLIPIAGWILSMVVMYILICKMMEVDFFPDAVIMVVVANIIAMLVDFALIAKLAGT